MKKISVLGSTGSIGTQTLDVAEHSDNIEIVGLTAGRNITLLEQQIRKFKPKYAACADEEKAALLRTAVSDTNTVVLGGKQGLCEIAADPENDAVVTSVVGIAGLEPTLAAIENGIDIALANKETLVTAGDIVMRKAKEHNSAILPVDSEHSAVFQCIGSHSEREVSRIIITASGGSQYGKKREELKNVTVSEALNHPNWDMGQKITIDSATLMNKGLEVIEAHHLFNMDYDKIDVVVHRQSIVHSMVEFADMSILAQLSLPDMRLPIHYALNYPCRTKSVMQPLDLTAAGTLTFERPDYETFSCLRLAVEAGRAGGTMPVVLNAANEIAVELFLKGKIKFLQIGEIVEKQLSLHNNTLNPKIDDIIETDREIRERLKLSLC